MKAIMRSISYVATLCLFLYSASASLIPKKQGIQTLVLLDDWATLQTHSILFDTLKKDGHNLVFENAYPGPQIKYYDEFFYDNIILMAPGVKGKELQSLNDLELRTPVDPKDLIAFLEANHNLMVFADAESKKPIRQLANEFGVEFEGAVRGIIRGIINYIGL